jgi:hypothetical protein
MSELLYISKCLRLVEQRVNRGSSEHWTSGDYKLLQKLVFDASSIHLSIQTLERLYGKLKIHKNYNPQTDTKNALALFLGYEDWEDFKSHHSVGIDEHIESSTYFLDVKEDDKQAEPISQKSPVKKVEKLLLYC